MEAWKEAGAGDSPCHLGMAGTVPLVIWRKSCARFSLSSRLV